MIHITKGQSPKDNPELVVLAETGDYDENDLIQCSKIGEVEPFCIFEAQYIVNGNKAYDETVIPT